MGNRIKKRGDILPISLKQVSMRLFAVSMHTTQEAPKLSRHSLHEGNIEGVTIQFCGLCSATNLEKSPRRGC